MSILRSIEPKAQVYIIVIKRCPSSRLLWNLWTEFNETWQEARSQSPLPNWCFRADRKNKMASDWLMHFRLVSNRWTELYETLQEARSQCPLPSLCFSGRSKIKKTEDDRPAFDFLSFETAERNSTTLDRKQVLNVLYQVCGVFLLAHCTQVHDILKFSDGRWEIENVSSNQRPGRPSLFSDRPEKHKQGRGRCDLVSCQVSLNSIPRLQKSSRKCLSQS